LAVQIVMPALGMAQETGKLVNWLKREGDGVNQGEPLMEIETDKATMEIEAPASGILSGLSAQPGDDIPVGRTIGLILAPGENLPERAPAETAAPVTASPVARRMAEEHGLDLKAVKPNGGRIGKTEVSAYLAAGPAAAAPVQPLDLRLAPASPKARRLAEERGLDLKALSGSGPDGAVLAADLDRAAPAPVGPQDEGETLGTLWRITAERMAASWTSAPHFYLVREARAAGLIEMRARLAAAVEKRRGVRLTYTDLLVKLAAAVLADHPQINASWTGKTIRTNPEIAINLAVGVADGLVAPVIRQADRISLGEIAARRQELVERAAQRRLRPEDLEGGTFTITNLGMYNVDAFMAILNPPQAAILAVGRITDRVVPENGQPVVRPTVILSLSCDHRVVDGVRAAQFLDDLINGIQEPWGVFA
jgi:pyruvate dehydrogenase E2 component (dihydrolipoamide acetyltransferase)